MKSLALIFALLASSVAQAHPHPIRFIKHHKLLIATSAVYLAASLADTEETIQGQRRCPACVETSDLYGPHPSAARLWGEGAAFDAGYIAFNWFGTKDTGLTGTHDIPADWKAKHKWFYRAIWMEKPGAIAVMGWATEAHARAAWHNAQIPASK